MITPKYGSVSTINPDGTEDVISFQAGEVVKRQRTVRQYYRVSNDAEAVTQFMAFQRRIKRDGCQKPSVYLEYNGETGEVKRMTVEYTLTI